MRNFSGRRLATAITVVLVLLSANPSQAVVSDDRAMIEGAKLCTSYLPRQERQYGIPEHLLAAIASTESGRYNKQLGLSLPWPWTINVEGKGYFFDTKEEAIAAVQGFQQRGFQSIDVGCMQVNLHHHPNAFSSLEQAFDPAYNVAYAAQFLKRNYDDEGSWHKATADYHSHTLFFGEQYTRLVYSAWSRIINKVADARAGQYALKSEAVMAPVNYVAASSVNNFKKPPRHMYQAVHMHSISVSRDASRENGVLVIRPEHNAVAAREGSTTENFVVSKPPQVDHPVRSPQLTKVQTSSVAKGQFEGSGNPHIINAGGNTPAADQSNKQNSVFVFDN